VFLRKQERDVDVDAFVETSFDRQPSLAGTRDFDHDVDARDRLPQSACLDERRNRVVCHVGRNLHRHEPVSAIGRVVHVTKQVGSLSDVCHRKRLEDVPVRRGRRGQFRQLDIVARTPGDGLREDGGIRRHAAKACVDERLQLPRACQVATEIVQPDALPQR
jgi:hypothetical protein